MRSLVFSCVLLCVLLYTKSVIQTLLYKSLKGLTEVLKYFKALYEPPTLTPKIYPTGYLSHVLGSACRFNAPGSAHPIRPDRSVQTDPVLGLLSRTGRC